MRPLKILTSAVFACALLVATPAALAAPKARAIKLPPKLAALLKQEMALLENGMRDLLRHIVRGETSTGARIADKVHASFILKRSLSKAQLKKLIGALPRPFIKLDRAFHKKGAVLAKTLRAGKLGKAVAIYATMVQACVSCHQRYAPALLTAGRRKR